MKKQTMEKSIQCMAQELDALLCHSLHSLWLYGSVVLDDFCLGWSDIDFIAFTKGPIPVDRAKKLLTLRQDLSARCPDNPYIRCFEGVIVNLQEYMADRYARLVYWGTTGQRIMDRFSPDAFSRFELSRYGRLVCGEKSDGLFREPPREAVVAAVQNHYEAIRAYAVQTDERLYSCGWLLDIARCLYTLRHNDVISKTRAGQWALDEHLFADPEPLRQTLLIRQNPLACKDQPEIQTWLRSLGPTIQRYADVLERELSDMA